MKHYGKNDLSAEELVRLGYSYRGGELVNKHGEPIRHINKRGYVRARIKRVEVLVHRAIWILHNGAIPSGLVVDHINGNRIDNRIENLQLLTDRQNAAKIKSNKSNTSGFRGVREMPSGKNARRWAAQVRFNKKQLHLGRFSCPISAGFAAHRKRLDLFGPKIEPSRFELPLAALAG